MSIIGIKVDEKYQHFFEEFWYVSKEWSRETFGPEDLRGPLGPLNHLQKELEKEIIPNPDDLEEYVDAFFLILDAVRRKPTKVTPEEFMEAVWKKLEKNKARTWPDWRTAPKDSAIEHDRSNE